MAASERYTVGYTNGRYVMSELESFSRRSVWFALLRRRRSFEKMRRQCLVLLIAFSAADRSAEPTDRNHAHASSSPPPARKGSPQARHQEEVDRDPIRVRSTVLNP